MPQGEEIKLRIVDEERIRTVTAFLTRSINWDFSTPVIGSSKVKIPNIDNSQLRIFPLRLLKAQKTYYQQPCSGNNLEKYQVTAAYAPGVQPTLVITAPPNHKDELYYLKCQYGQANYTAKIRIICEIRLREIRLRQVGAEPENSPDRQPTLKRRTRISPSPSTGKNLFLLHGVKYNNPGERLSPTSTGSVSEKEEMEASAAKRLCNDRAMETGHETELGAGAQANVPHGRVSSACWSSHAGSSSYGNQPSYYGSHHQINRLPPFPRNPHLVNHGEGLQRITGPITFFCRSRLNDECQHILKNSTPRFIKCMFAVDPSNEPREAVQNKLQRVSAMASAMMTLDEFQLSALKQVIFSKVEDNKQKLRRNPNYHLLTPTPKVNLVEPWMLGAQPYHQQLSARIMPENWAGIQPDHTDVSGQSWETGANRS